MGPPFLITSLDGAEWSASGPQYPLDKRLARHKSFSQSNPGRPARSSYLYRLSYPGSMPRRGVKVDLHTFSTSALHGDQ
jgi:hypothetical protein